MKKKLVYISLFLIILFIILRFKTKTKTIKSVSYPSINVDMFIEDNLVEGKYLTLGQDLVVEDIVKGVVKSSSNKDNYVYIEYKINDSYYATSYYPEHNLKIDTTNLPNGWNKLLIIAYEEADKIKGVKQILFRVDNQRDLETRALRQEFAYTVSDKLLYGNKYIPVLMYHDFKENITREQESISVHPELFEQQLQALLDNEYTPISFKDLYSYMLGERGLPAKPVIITADDGYLSNYEIAYPILKKYNIPATYFITTQYVGVTTMNPHFTWEQAKEMEQSGIIDIQSHTHSHILMSKIRKEEALYQASVSFGIIEQKLGKRDVKVLSYPQFYHNRKTKKWLQELGVDLQVTNLASSYFSKTTPLNVKRIHVANFTTPEELIKSIEKVTKQ